MNIALLNRLRDAAGDCTSPGPACGPSSPTSSATWTSWRPSATRSSGTRIGASPTAGRPSGSRPTRSSGELGTRRIGRRVAVWNRVEQHERPGRARGGVAGQRRPGDPGRGADRGPRSARAVLAGPAEFGALLLSVLVFPPPELAAPGWLTALGAVAVAEVAESWTGRPARIKWPNDVRVDGRKVAGILVERAPGSVIGIGLNVNAAPEDFPEPLRETATSLRTSARPAARPLRDRPAT